LILLCLILGLPAVLIVLTASRWSYVVWMLIYLLALPIWNGLLPLYAYWKFDDFSWGDTRKTASEEAALASGMKKKGADGHGDAEGEFDSSRIVMKRWGDFEAERRGGRGGAGGRGSVGTGLNVGYPQQQQQQLGARSSSAWARQTGPPSAWNSGGGGGDGYGLGGGNGNGRRTSRSAGRGSRSRSRSGQRRPESHDFV